METKNSVFKLIVMVLVLLGLLYAAIKLSQHPITPSAQTTTQPPQSVDIKNIDNSSLPDKFPADLPTEDGSKIIHNFNATEVDGRYNATREFESKKTLAQNISTYTQYLKANGWEIKATVNQSTIKMVMGQKGKQQLQIAAAQNPSTKNNIVTITLTEFK